MPPLPETPSPAPFRLANRRPRRRIAVSLTPLIDVVFILLVFFMLATSFLRPASITLLPPGNGAAPPAAPGESLVIDVLDDRRLRLDGLPIAPEQLAATLRARAPIALPVVVRAAAGVRVQTTVTVLETVKGAGAERVRLTGAPTNAPGGPATP